MEGVSATNDNNGLGVIQSYTILKEVFDDDDMHTYPLFLACYRGDFAHQAPFFAIKAIPVLDNRNSFQNEVAVARLSPHTNILNCIEIIEKVQLNFGRFLGRRYNLLVYPFKSNGDLFEITSQMRFDEQMIRYYIPQILDAVEHLHKNGLAHRDIKLDNVLVDENYKLVLADFGFTVNHSNYKGPRMFETVTSIGICPPEYHSGGGYKGVDMDLFAIGKLLLTMATGINPFMKANAKDLQYKLVEEGDWETFWKTIETCVKKKWIKETEFTLEFKELIQGLLSPDPSKRWGIEQIRESEWFEKTMPKNFDEIQSSLQKARISVSSRTSLASAN